MSRSICLRSCVPVSWYTTTNTTTAETSITPATQAVRRHCSPAGSSERRGVRLVLPRRLPARIEAVADRADRDDRPALAALRRSGFVRIVGLLLPDQLPAQVADVHVDDVGAGVVLVSPDSAKDLLARENLSSISHEVCEELELSRRQTHRLACASHLPRQKVDLHVPRDQGGLRDLGRRPELSTDARGELG